MHSDNDPTLQPENTYRDGQNGDLIAYGNNNYSFESVKGNKVSFSLTDHQSGANKFTIIGWASFIDKLIVFSANDKATGSEPYPGEIGKVTFAPDGAGTYTPLYYHYKLNFTKQHPIPNFDQGGVVVKPENDSIQRVYWTDNYNPIRVINTSDSRYTTYYTTGNLIVGEQYMVLNNAGTNTITHNAVVYGPGEVAGNVFTAVNNAFAGGALVIRYVPVEALDIVPFVNMGNINFKMFNQNGSLLSGSYQYFYQLETFDGSRTNWSYVTRPMFVPGAGVPDDTTQGYQKYQGSRVFNSFKSLTLTISSIDTVFARIRVGFIRSEQFETYKDPEVFAYIDITGASMDITHYGNETTEKLLLKDITVIGSTFEVAKAIASTKNIFFAANLGLPGDPDFTPSTATVVTFPYIIPSDVAGDVDANETIANGFGLYGHKQSKDRAVGANTNMLPYQWYEVMGTGTLTYNAVVYNVGDHFQGVYNVTAVSAGTAKAMAVIRRQKYTGVYEYTPIEKDYCDTKGGQVAKMRSYWRDEKYRLGVMLWGKQMQPLFVRWMADKTFPSQYATTDPDSGGALGYDPMLAVYDSGGTDVSCSLRTLQLRVSSLNFSQIATALGTTVAELPNFIRGFSIVRAPRDQQIVGQGILYPTMIDGSQTRPLSIGRLDHDYHYNGGAANLGRRPNYYNWYCPDFQIHFNNRPNKASGDYLKIQDYYTHINASDWDGTLIISNHNYCYKHYVQYAPAAGAIYAKGSTTNIITDRTYEVNEASQSVTINGLPGAYFHEGHTVAGSAPGERWGIQGKGMIVGTDSDEVTLPLGFGYHTTGTLAKAVVNWVRPKSNLYGGTTDQAKADTKYIYCDHFQPLDSGFMAHLAATGGVANNVEVFGGDCFVALHGFARQRRDQTSPNNQVSFGCVFPVESNCNLALRVGNTFGLARFYEATESPNGITHPWYPEDWTYDGMHSNDVGNTNFPAKPRDFTPQRRDPHMIIHSLFKTDGEIIDNFRIFKANNFRRVDGQHGHIYAAQAMASFLIYWQTKGVGYMPVQERITTSTVLGEALQLGVGGIIDRFEELDTFYGTQHQFSLMKSESSYLWYDLRRRAMVRMGIGGGKPQNLGIVDGMSAYLQTFLDEVENENPSSIFDSDNPLTGKGILSYYDPSRKRGFMTFKYDQMNVLGFGAGHYIEKDFTLGFSEMLDKYVGFFSFSPGHAVSHNGHLLMSRYTRPGIIDSTAYTVGMQLTQSGVSYVCILAYTSGAPATAPASDATHWTEVSNLKQVYVCWRNDYCKFFGVVYRFSLTGIVSAGGEEIVVDNVSTGGNNTQYTDIYTSCDLLTAADNDVPANNRIMRYFGGQYFMTLPLMNKLRRISGTYLQIKLEVKNFTGNVITTSLNKVKRITFLKSFIRRKQ